MTYNFGCGHRQQGDEKSCLKGCSMGHGQIGYFNYQSRTARYSRVVGGTGDSNKAQQKRSAKNRRERKVERKRASIAR